MADGKKVIGMKYSKNLDLVTCHYCGNMTAAHLVKDKKCPKCGRELRMNWGEFCDGIDTSKGGEQK